MKSDESPDPWRAGTPAEFVAEMRRLRAYSGQTFRQLERKAEAAGDVLPHSTLVAALHRDRLPREELLRAFTRACGCSPEAAVHWMEARRHLAVAAVTPPPSTAAWGGARPVGRSAATGPTADGAARGRPTGGGVAGLPPMNAAGGPATAEPGDGRGVDMDTAGSGLRPGPGGGVDGLLSGPAVGGPAAAGAGGGDAGAAGSGVRGGGAMPEGLPAVGRGAGTGGTRSGATRDANGDGEVGDRDVLDAHEGVRAGWGARDAGKVWRFLLGERGRQGVLVAIGLSVLMALGGSSVGATPMEGLPETGGCVRTLVQGATGPCVQELQAQLRRRGFDLPADSWYGPLTEMRVMAFQAYAGLTSSGITDRETWDALRSPRPLHIPRWSAVKVESRIREVFARDAQKAVELARCLSSGDHMWVQKGEEPGARRWGVFQFTDLELFRARVMYAQALDPEWNIQAAHAVWRRTGDFRHWKCRPGPLPTQGYGML
ncbi:peptidoglycan-binding domain-containing protein [Spongiactinospora sp. TRM90649]|uniref:peptidoglycan-binding domain-containing protein n=1 Tax=Spongiactinospora sp. TRM90649 TaxID=3031114 RepID=UPI0023FA2FCA|nr:peptidoglycan-binding domain-containing protein [Spongiactinospora sp. TRM90649]MDF5752644.1 peptidoglycan-binding domain-containing protein [Spongiactinospora sp. TRM90649]